MMPSFDIFVLLNSLILSYFVCHRNTPIKKGARRTTRSIEIITFSWQNPTPIWSYCSAKSDRIPHRNVLLHMHFLNKRKTITRTNYILRHTQSADISLMTCSLSASNCSSSLSILNPAKKRRSLLLLVTSMFTTSAGLFLFAANSLNT